MAKIIVGSFGVTTCEFIWIDFSTHSVDSNSKIMISNCSISGLNSPKRFRDPIDCCRRIEYDFSAIESKSQPMKWMVSSITDINCYLTKLSIKNWMSCFSFHVIGRLIEISNSWDMTFLLFAQDVAIVVDYRCRVVQSLFILLSL